MAKLAHLSSNRSRFACRFALFALSGGALVLVLHTVVSMGMTVSVPYTKSNGVSLVGVRTVVQ